MLGPVGVHGAVVRGGGGEVADAVASAFLPVLVGNLLNTSKPTYLGWQVYKATGLLV